MTRVITVVAIGGIATALVCLPLAGSLHRHFGDAGVSWEFPDHIVWSDDDVVRGDMTVESRDFTWDGSDSLDLDIPAKFHYHPAPEWHLSIRGPRAVLDRIKVGDGKIHSRPFVDRGDSDLSIEMSGPSLRSLALNGSGNAQLDQLKQDDLSVDIRGSGSARATGSVGNLTLNIMGSGSAMMAQLPVRSVHIMIAGSGDADIEAHDDADIMIAGSGQVRLHSHPKHLSTRTVGSGQVIEDAADQAT